MSSSSYLPHVEQLPPVLSYIHKISDMRFPSGFKKRCVSKLMCSISAKSFFLYLNIFLNIYFVTFATYLANIAYLFQTIQ